jgi:hypothetical protein
MAKGRRPGRSTKTKQAAPSLTERDALRIIRELAQDSRRIVLLNHAKKRMLERHVNLKQVELCVQKGMITEGPSMNTRANWQVNMSRYAADEEVTCTVIIDDLVELLLIRTVMTPKGRRRR